MGPRHSKNIRLPQPAYHRALSVNAAGVVILKERRDELEAWVFIKTGILSGIGVVASIAVESMGGYDHFLRALIVFMAIDCVTGWTAAAVFKKSRKTETGRLSSGVCFRGIAKKGCMMLMVIVAVMLDGLMQTGELARDAVIIAFIINELISILENAGHMGIKMPEAVKNSLELLGRKKTSGK
jgi:toxin secretion/phage lysis holin